MNKKAHSETFKDNVIYIVLLAIFIAGMSLFIYSQLKGATSWADYYAKETARIINLAQPGDVIVLDIQKATEIAQSNEVSSFSEIVSFDNAKKEVCYKLSKGKATCYYFFNDVDITNREIKLGVPGNILVFELVKSRK